MSELLRDRWINRTSRIVGAVAAIAFAMVVAIQLFYAVYFFRFHFNSDDAVVNMLGEAIWRQGRLFPAGWISYNGDLMVPSGALIVACLLGWLPNGFHAHAVVGVLAIGFLLGSLIWLLRVLKIPREVAVLVATLSAYGFSLTFSEMVFQQTTYFWWPAGFFIGAALIGMYRTVPCAASRLRVQLPYFLFVVVFCISFANPARVAVMMAGPLYCFDWVLRRSRRLDASSCGNAWRRWLSRIGADDPLTAIGLAAAFACASFAYVALGHFGITQTVHSATNLHWGGWSSIGVHAVTFAKGWFYYLGVDWSALAIRPLPLVSWMRALVPLALTSLGLYELLRSSKKQEPARLAVKAAFVAAFVPILLLYLFFEPLASGLGTVRYFTVPIFILLLLVAFRLRDIFEASRSIAGASFAACCVGLVFCSACIYFPGVATGSPFWQVRTSQSMRLAELLTRERLQWGYATWWNAGVATVLTDSDVRVSPVVIDQRGLSPSNAMVLKSWYAPSEWTGETFLALTRLEADPRTLAILSGALGTPRRVIDSPDYRVLVYDRNIAEHFGCFGDGRANAPIGRGSPTARIVSADIVDTGDSLFHLLKVRVHNDGRESLSGSGHFPLAVGVQLLDAAGTVVKPDWVHAPLSCPLSGDAEIGMSIALPEVLIGQWRIRVDLVQEGVSWFRNLGMPTKEIVLGRAAIEPVAVETPRP